jgi:hypothetical protein
MTSLVDLISICVRVNAESDKVMSINVYRVPKYCLARSRPMLNPQRKCDRQGTFQGVLNNVMRGA